MIDYDSDAGAWQAEIDKTPVVDAAKYGIMVVAEDNNYAVYSGAYDIPEMQDYIGEFKPSKYGNINDYYWEPAEVITHLTLSDMIEITNQMRNLVGA